MIFGVLIPAAILGTIALVVALVVQRARGGLELSPRGLLRLYLYIASLAGLVVLTIGLASIVNFALAATAGDEFIYGGPPRVAIAPVPPTCPPGAPNCAQRTPEQDAQFQRQQDQQRERRRNEDLIRGITFTVFGAAFWAAHWMARRGLGEDDPAMTGLRRGYLMLGTIVFGLTTVVLLPTGIYQALANAILPTSDNLFRQGADALGGGLVSLPIWLVFLRFVVTEFREK